MFLFLDTADPKHLRAALFHDRGVLARQRIGRGSRARKNFLAGIAKLLKDADMRPKEIEGVIVVTGPGAFSSLRLGVSIANGFAAVLRIPLGSVTADPMRPASHVLRETKWLRAGQTITPQYGKEPNITRPKSMA